MCSKCVLLTVYVCLLPLVCFLSVFCVYVLLCVSMCFCCVLGPGRLALCFWYIFVFLFERVVFNTFTPASVGVLLSPHGHPVQAPLSWSGLRLLCFKVRLLCDSVFVHFRLCFSSSETYQPRTKHE